MMFEQDYKAVFLKVKASDETHRRIMNMAKEENKKPKHTLTRMMVIAAIISILAVTASASEYAQNWFTAYFSNRSEKPLSTQQIAYIEENVQVIEESKIENGWTVALRSAMNDENVGYIIVGVTAPDGTDLNPEYDEMGNRLEFFKPGNMGVIDGTFVPEMLQVPSGIRLSSWDYSWEEDGDGLCNTKNMVIRFYPDMEHCTADPFGSNAEYHIYMENIVREYDDKVYLQELRNGKYAGQTYFITTPEETQRLTCTDVLAEGTWEFSVNFSGENGEASAVKEIEMLSQPVTTMAQVLCKTGSGIIHYAYVEKAVTMTSVVIRPLTVTIMYEDCDGTPSFTLESENRNGHIYAVMKDNSRIELLPYGSRGSNFVTLEAQTPIVLEEVDCILMLDGTAIPMPEITTE